MILGSLGFVWSPYACLTDVLGRVRTPAGRYFEASQTTCSALAKGATEISVFASQTSRRKKALIFKYERMNDGSRNAEPTITPIDDRIIRISVKHVAEIICQSRRWGAWTIEYDIGRVVDDFGPPRECLQE
jgi:hypothetical protein